MTRTLLLIVLFFTSAIVQIGVVNSLTPPLHLLPLHFLLGVLVLHRAGPELGASWFVASAFTLPILGFDNIPWFAYLLVAGAGIFFTTRLFTNRSVYALEGLVFALFLIVEASRFLVEPGGFTLSNTILTLLLLFLFTYVGFLIAKMTERILYRFFLVRTHHAVTR